MKKPKPLVVSDHFRWHSVDVESYLDQHHRGWKEEIINVASTYAVTDILRPSHETSREDSSVTELPILRVPGSVVEKQLPWLTKLYEEYFRELGELCTGQKLFVGKDVKHRLALNVQQRNLHHQEQGRYESHVDSNPIEALLYVTSHSRDAGGTLIVADDLEAKSIDEIEIGASRISPQTGHILFFDATKHPHYVNALKNDDLRVAVAMNYYTLDMPESTRPATLDAYLTGTKIV